MKGHRNVPQVVLILLNVAAIILVITLLYWAGGAPQEQHRIRGLVTFIAALVGLPVVASYTLACVGRKIIQKEEYKSGAFVLRDREAVTAGQRLILVGRCILLFGVGIMWIILLDGLFWRQ